MSTRVLILGCCALAACQGESPVEPLGVRLRERPELGPVAEAIRRDAADMPACASMSATAGSGWVVRTLTRPAVRVALPGHLLSVTSPKGEQLFYAPDMSAGVFVEEAVGMAILEVLDDSSLANARREDCRVQVGAVDGLVHLFSQLHPVFRRDSVHLVFLQLAGPGNRAIRAGAFAVSRELRDSLLGALLALEPGDR